MERDSNLYFRFFVCLFIFLAFLAILDFVFGVIILTGDTIYSSNDTNVTQEFGFAHLNISTNAPYDDLRAYWSFDVDNTSVAYDLSENNFDGNYTNGAINNGTNCIYDNCSFFDGSNDNITIPSGDKIFTSNLTWTITAWFNAKNITDTSGSNGIITFFFWKRYSDWFIHKN